MIRKCGLLLLPMLIATPVGVTQIPRTEAPAKIETKYDRSKNRTTISLVATEISGEKDKYHSIHMAPSFSFPGRQSQRPTTIDFELQTVVKTRLLDSDLYVAFIIDGETIFLSSNRSAVARPVPGRRWVGERLVCHMPYQVFVRVVKARSFALRFDGVTFEVGESQMQSLRELADKMN